MREAATFAKERSQSSLRSLDVTSQKSADEAVATILKDQGRLDVVVHNAGHMVFDPAEAFTPEQ